MDELAKILAKIYFDKENYHRILTRAEIDIARVKSADVPQNFWFNAIAEAENLGKTDLVIRVAIEDYPKYEASLRQAQASLEKDSNGNGASDNDRIANIDSLESPAAGRAASDGVQGSSAQTIVNKPIDGPVIQQAQELLMSMFDVSALKQFMRFNLNKNLDDVVKNGNRPQMVFDLLGWLERNQRIEEFFHTLAVAHPEREDVKSVRDSILAANNSAANESTEAPKPPLASPQQPDTVSVDLKRFYADLKQEVQNRVESELSKQDHQGIKEKLAEAANCEVSQLCSNLCAESNVADCIKISIVAYKAYRESGPPPEQLENSAKALHSIVGWVVLLSIDPGWLAENKKLLNEGSVVFVPHGTDLNAAIAVSALIGKAAGFADTGDDILHDDPSQIRYGLVEGGASEVESYNRLLVSIWNKFVFGDRVKPQGSVLTEKEINILRGTIEGVQLGGDPVHLVMENGGGHEDAFAHNHFKNLRRDLGEFLPVMHSKPSQEVDALRFGEGDRLTGLLRALLREIHIPYGGNSDRGDSGG